MRGDLALATSALVLVTFAVSASPAVAQGDDQSAAELLNPVPEIELDAGSWTATDDERQQIARLIDSLAGIEDPDYGFAPFMSGAQFAPVSDSSSFGAGIIMINHGLKTSDALRQLVAVGPMALPQLLERLTDETPTKLVMEHGGGFGAQWYAREIPMNLASEAERQARHRLDESTPDGAVDDHVNGHPVTIGDVCYVIIGQIVNRGYQSVRYQPTACRVINSPTHDPLIADIVRGIWTSDTPAQRLMDSLLIDLYTKDETDLQCGAAMRLLYYFPDKSAELIARRITGFDLRQPTADNEWRTIYEKNGVRAADFIKAVRASSHPAVIDALLHVVRQTDDPDNFQAAVTAAVVERAPDLVFDRMQQIVSTPDQGPFGGEYHTLIAAATYFPEKSRELFEIYRGHNTIATLRSTIHALDKPADPRDWMTDYLSALLDDRRDTGWEYGPDYDRQPIRICDEAAKVLAQNYLDDVRFDYEKNPTYLDQQISKMKRVLAGETGISFAPPDRPVIPANLPQREAMRVTELGRRLTDIYAFSTKDVFWMGGGSRARAGYAWTTWTINAETGEVTDKVPLDQWHGGVNLLRNAPADREFAYHGYEGGDVSIHDVRTGRLIKTLATPFHDGVQFNDPLQVRNLSDITLCGVNGEWIIAVTQDGSLHSIDVETGRHRVEWREKSENLEVLGVQGTSRVLLEGVGGESLFDVPIQLWDQSTRTRRTIEKAPYAGWRVAWGDLAWNDFNGCATLWNLARTQELQLPDSEVPIESITCNSDQSRLFLLRSDGSVEVFAVRDGVKLDPIFRLLPPTTDDLDVSIAPGADDRLLFWLGRPRSRIAEDGQRIPAEPRTVIGVFDCGELTD